MGWRRPWASTGAAALLILLTTGCAFLARNGQNDLFDAAAREGEWVRIEVRNENFQDARIYALWGPARQRIGLVIGRTTQTIQTEWRTSGELLIEVDFLAGGGFIADPGPVWPGETVVLQIPP